MIKRPLSCFILFFLLSGLWPVTAWAASEIGAEQALEEPIEITSERLEVDEQAGTAIFFGQVVARQGEMTIYSEKLILYRSEELEEVEKLEASGGVRIVQQDRVGTAQHASFYMQEEKLVLSGDAKIQQDQNLVAGEEITLFLKENRSLVKSGSDGRVRAVFIPEQEQK